MDALKLNLKLAALCLFLAACSNSGSDEIDAQAKNSVLSNTMLFSVKQQCIPAQVLDEEDIPLLTRQGYAPNVNNEFCLPPVDNNDGDDTVSNCIRDAFIDEQDLAYLLSQGYVPGANGDYCLVIGGGTTSGGSTTGSGTTSGGEVSGGTTSGGSVTGGETSGAATSGGSVTGGEATGSVTGSTTGAGEISGGSVSGGSVSGGEVNGGTTSGGSVTGGETSGAATTGGGEASGGMTSGGNMSGGLTSGGETSGASTGGGSVSGGASSGGSTSGGSVSGGETSGGSTSGGATSGGSSSGGMTSGGSSGGDDECKPWGLPLDRMCSRIRTGSGRYKIKDRLELVLQVLKKEVTYEEVEECKEPRKRNSFWSALKGDKDQRKKCDKKHKHSKDCDHDDDEDDSKVVCKKVKKEVVRMIPICESRDTAKIKKDVLEKRRLDFSNCNISGYNKKDLFVTLFSPVEPTDLPISASNYENVRFFAKDSGQRGKDELSFILYGSRANRYANIREKIVVIVDDNPDMNKQINKDDCDLKASPLIVHVNPEHDVAKYVQLSSIDDGIDFNILGFNAEPRAHAPKQISWLNNDQYMFLVKPNKRGRVEGVDEMFGDNTRGPDRDFAANGFIALAKYDDNGDGLINRKDAVYRQLRLWHDKNFDGVGTPSELFTLERMKVKTIDLRYDASFREQDAYGNETVYKSVIQYNDGSLDLIFDLWFNYKK